MSETSEGQRPPQTEKPAESPKNPVIEDLGGVLPEKTDSQENGELAEQQKELAENLTNLRDNLVQFSDDDPRIPAGDQTRKLLGEVGKKTGEGAKIAKIMAGLGTIFAAAGEATNYWYGSPTSPGTTTALIAGASAVIGLPFAAVTAGEKMIAAYNKLRQRAEANNTGGNNS